MKSQAFFTFLWSCSLVTAASIGAPDARDAAADSYYDAIVVGGGPAGLSALSGLARVRRRAILIDSGEYRNDATRHMHDVIGVDGKPISRRKLGRPDPFSEEAFPFRRLARLEPNHVTQVLPRPTSGGSLVPSWPIMTPYS